MRPDAFRVVLGQDSAALFCLMVQASQGQRNKARDIPLGRKVCVIVWEGVRGVLTGCPALGGWADRACVW